MLKISRLVARISPGLRRAHAQEIGLIEASGDEPVNVLLDILRSAGAEQLLEIGDIASRRGGDQPVVQRGDECRLGAAARAAGDSKPDGIDLRAARQIIDAADAIPDKRSEWLAGTKAGVTGAKAKKRSIGRS